jgi:glycosyltransferase involved in cell wall biosynthesis
MHIGFIEDTHLNGGTQIWVTEANLHFLAHGNQTTVLAPKGSWVAVKSANSGTRLVTYNWDRIAVRSRQYTATWSHALTDCDVAICTVHPPRNGFHCSVFAAKCIREGALKTHLITKTGTIVHQYRREFYRPDKDIASTVIAIADFTRRYLIDIYKIRARLVTRIYQGVDLGRFHSTAASAKEAQKRYPIKQGTNPILACVGSFEARKGQAVLLEALARLAAGPLPEIHLLLVGDGPHRGLLRDKIQEMRLEDRVSLFPFTDEPQYVFERADITVLPSLRKEGLPNVLLESMAMGVPTVATNLGGVPEVVLPGKTGYLVEAGDVAQLAGAILQLATDRPTCMRMGIAGRKLMEDRHDRETQFESFLRYCRAIHKRKAGDI